MEAPERAPAAREPVEPVVGHAARALYAAAGLGCLGLAALGAMLPGLPSTVFVIMAAWCFGRSSSRLERWLLDHPRFGPPLRGWRAHGAIPRSAKAVALGSMAVSGAVTALTAPWIVGAGVSAVLVACAAYVATRPDGPVRPDR